MDRPFVILRPQPQAKRVIFTPQTWVRLNDLVDLLDLSAEPDPGFDSESKAGSPPQRSSADLEAELDAALPRAFAVIGQPDLPAERLHRAERLRAVLNVEGNFYPNVDYATCFARGIRVLGCGPAYAQPVAEYALGLALDLARGISREDRAFRAGRERYLAAGNADAILLRGAPVGLIGFGNLGRALRPLLAPFAGPVRVFDPWLPDELLREFDIEPADLPNLLRTSQFVFVLATVTEQSRNLLGAAELELLPAGARLVLVSRAPVADFDALLRRVAEGRLLAAIDVWPDEPVPPDHPARQLDGLVLSAHRAGGIPAAFHRIGEMVLDDLASMLAGLPPNRMQVAQPELVGRYRNRPAS